MAADQSIEELDAETAALQARLAEIRKKKGIKEPVAQSRKAGVRGRKPVRDGDTLRAIQDDRSIKNQTRIMLAGYQGKTIIQRIEIQMDKRRRAIEKHITAHGVVDGDETRAVLKGRYEGLAAALVLLRNSSLEEEFKRSNERLDIS